MNGAALSDSAAEADAVGEERGAVLNRRMAVDRRCRAHALIDARCTVVVAAVCALAAVRLLIAARAHCATARSMRIGGARRGELHSSAGREHRAAVRQRQCVPSGLSVGMCSAQRWATSRTLDDAMRGVEGRHRLN